MIKVKVKRVLKFLYVKISRFILSLFYNCKYLQGRYFEESIAGFKWAWKSLIWQKVFRINSHIPWPVSPFISISCPENIIFEIDDLHNFQNKGTYFQNFNGKIIIGKGSFIAPNVGLITANHNFLELDKHDLGEDIIIGEKCWIGMNSVLLPGVNLGNNTIVGAGSVVTKSFPDGNCVIAGNPAKIIKMIK
ncbi:hypothetical protein JK636_11230 [Clostridium sp. YIM B02515]|uniref:Acyltransferase n=1 Tax=Clostridium rhizosphaerae TaxID=2803861 RepID=A0ABS1TAE7_9CLOT|nr:DapH/DapD/GlmU-related protein [Clostridium rhizosphaerae]MBL4936333.1 hypothetical protein [Clostridium rhizosphaerae]